jgi:hypothetical protein
MHSTCTSGKIFDPVKILPNKKISLTKPFFYLSKKNFLEKIFFSLGRLKSKQQKFVI